MQTIVVVASIIIELFPVVIKYGVIADMSAKEFITIEDTCFGVVGA